MSITQKDLLRYAKSIDSSADELEIRSGISRAYYAMFHQGRESVTYCPDIDPSSGEGSHSYLIRRFQSVPRKRFHGSTQARIIGDLLGKAKFLRTKADYELKHTCSERDLSIQIMHAEQLYEAAQALEAMHSEAS